MKAIIIAEAGVNHNGEIDKAFKFIDVAKDVDADFIKFQTFKADSLVSKNAPKAECRESLTDKRESQYEMIKSLELDLETHRLLKRKCEKVGIDTFIGSGAIVHNGISIWSNFVVGAGAVSVLDNVVVKFE